jgi:hypothetical protein
MRHCETFILLQSIIQFTVSKPELIQSINPNGFEVHGFEMLISTPNDVFIRKERNSQSKFERQ